LSRDTASSFYACVREQAERGAAIEAGEMTSRGAKPFPRTGRAL
jgi:hypothetical protein